MTTLVAVLTHLDAAAVDEQVRVLRAIVPGARVAVCHAGPRAAFDALAYPDKAWVNDPSLQGAAQSFQSYHVTLTTIWDEWFRHDAELSAVHLIEYDHLVLRGDYVEALDAVAERTGADVLGKDAFRRSATNWAHYCRFRRDEPLLAHLRRLSVREEPETLFGILGNGIRLSRAAVADYVAIAEHPPCYGELYVPTLLHHLGHRVVDLDAHSDLFAHVRWGPPFAPAEVTALAAGGARCVHPVKDMVTWTAAARAAVAGT
jgi:hypothetical protein